MQKFNFKTKVWVYPGAAAHSTGSGHYAHSTGSTGSLQASSGRSAGAWHFASLPKGLSRDLKKWFGEEARGWGSLPVEVELGKSKWKTSIFPDSKTKTYLLPLKAVVRKKENILVNRTYSFSVQILV